MAVVVVDMKSLLTDIFMCSPGKHMKLAPAAEEVATFFGKMLDHDYTTKEVFRKNFFKDWRKVGMRTAESIHMSSNKYFQRVLFWESYRIGF